MRRKRKKPLLSFTNIKQLLHSITKGKSTYFYFNNGEPSSSKSSNHSFTNGLRVRLSSLREHAQSPTIPSAILTRRSPNNKSPYSKTIGWRRNYILPVVCSVALLLVLGCMINPFLSGGDGEKVYAEEGIAGQADTTGMSVSLTMANPDQTLLQQNAKAGEMSYISSGFTVKTENVDGYNVYVQTAPGSTNKLTNGNLSIDFVTTETPVSGFTDNTWGYAVDDTGTTVENLKYNPIPDTASAMNPAYTSSSTGETRNFTLNFATKFGSNATPGHYTSGVLLSVAAGAEEVTSSLGFAGATYMQDVDKSFCDNNEIPIGTEGRLIDKRDGKTYWIGKMKDGLCWMTQNLDFDLAHNITLTSELSDVSSDWKPTLSTTQKVSNWSSHDDTNTLEYSYDPGLYVYTKPLQIDRCPDGNSIGLDACIGDGWSGVGGMAISDRKDWNEALDYINNTYNAHMAAGNYYSYYAATAESGRELANAAYNADNPIQNAPDSICPRGWKLPLQTELNSNALGEISNLANLYSYSSNTSRTVSPLYFVMAGHVAEWYNVGGGLGHQGLYAQYWSAATQGVNQSGYPYALYIYTGISGNIRKNVNSAVYGMSVRCVAR